MRGYLAVLLLAFVALPATSVPVDIQVSLDPNRPLSLYEGPQTYRRDSRGRPFKSIIVTSKPFGFGNSVGSNSVRDVTTTSTSTTTTSRPFNFGRPLKTVVITSKPFGIGDNNSVQDSTTTTTTTTPNPLFVKVTPTIPFFSISCTVGSSCSQIISARQTPTVKPTFKPYTKEEINKFKGTLSSRFPPKFKSNLTTTTTTTTTTEKPSTSGGLHLWRIRTTSSLPTSTGLSTTTAATTTSKPTRNNNKPSSNWNSRWKWPTQIVSAAYDDVIGQQDVIQHSNNQRVETIPSGSLPIKPSSAGFLWNPVRSKPNPVRNSYETITDDSNSKSKVPSSNNGGWLSILTSSFNALQLHPSSVQRQQPQQQHQTKTTTLLPMKIVTRPVKPRPTSPVTDHQTDRWNSQAAWSNEVNSLSWKPEETITEVPHHDTRTKTNYHEVISNKGNKISLITGSRQQQQQVKPVQPTQYSAVLPPEVSVSSHVIGLRVKPKSLESGGVFVENVQGVAVETDGENVNLSDLIMKDDLQQQRPARYLPYTTQQASYSTGAGSRNQNNWSRTIRQQDGYQPQLHSFDSLSQWRPVRFPHP